MRELLERMQQLKERPSVSYSLTIRVTYPHVIGALARIAQVFQEQNAFIGAIEILRSTPKETTREITVQCHSEQHEERIVQALRELEGLRVDSVVPRVFAVHREGKIAIQNKIALTSREQLSLAYTPGVARVCEAIAADVRKAYAYTIKANSVAVVSDGTAVLGLGDIGPEGAMPVMEGKAMLFKEFGGVDAYPICLRTKNSDEIIRTVANFSVGFGGINLEDISAPRCFDIEERLQAELDIPVFHDDQHGTAIVTLAGLQNCLRLTGRRMEDLKIVIAGAGAAGVAITKILLSSGARDIVVCDRVGAIGKKRLAELNDSKKWLAAHTNPRGLNGTIEQSLRGADVFIGVSGPNVIKGEALNAMADQPFVFAMANPTPEVPPEEAMKKAYVVATGRSDYPNQINNVLAFPGIFRGALDCRAKRITESMKLAAATAIANCVSAEELSPEYIVPSVFNRDVVKRVSAAVQEAAKASGAV